MLEASGCFLYRELGLRQEHLPMRKSGIRDTPQTPHSGKRPRTYLRFFSRKLADRMTGRARFLLPTWSGCFLIAIRRFGCRIRAILANQRPSRSATIEARMMDSNTKVKCVRGNGVQGGRDGRSIYYYSIALPNKLGNRNPNRVRRLNTMPVSDLFQHLHPLVLTRQMIKYVLTSFHASRLIFLPSNQ